LVLGMKFGFPRRAPKRQLSPVNEGTAYTPHPVAPGTWLGEYKIEGLVSQSRSGYTYAANSNTVLIQEYFPCDIAIRDSDGTSVLLQDESENPGYEHGLSQFLLLARILSQIDQPGRVVHYQEQHDTAWYAIHFEPRASLKDLLGLGKRLPENALQSILDAALIYLDAAHQHEIFHLELGPGQLILSAEEELIICGFNVARLRGPVLGDKETAYYFAPEHLHTAGRLGAWSDFYSLGAILYHGLDPRIPPTAARRQAALQAEKIDPLVPAAKLGKGYYSGEFLEIIDWLLEISTGDRPISVEHLMRELDPDQRVIRRMDESSSVSYGPAFDSQFQHANQLKSDIDFLVDDERESFDSTVAPNISSTASDTILTGTAGLAIAALNANSEDPSSRAEVTNALEQASKILEPASPSRRWGNRLAEDSEGNLPMTIRDHPIFPAMDEISDERKGWRTLLRPRAFSSGVGKSKYLSNPPDSNTRLAEAAVTRTHAGGSLFRDSWTRSPLLWLSLLGAFTVIGVWLWLQVQSTPITEPTRIEVLGLENNTSVNQLEGGPTPPDLDSPYATLVNSTPTDLPSVDSLLSDARRYAAEGAWFGNTSDNAYAAYQKVLLLAPSSTFARTGVNELIKQSLLQISSHLDRRQVEPARALMTALRQREIGVRQLPELENRLRTIENELRQEELAQTVIQEQRQKETEIRRQKINNLLNRASNAFENGNLIQPQGENALTLYRAALDLDRNNQRARNGINSIGDYFVQQARMALATADLNRAEHNLQRATAVRKGDPTIRRLQQQLAQRRDLLRREQKIQAELAAKQAEAERLALEQTKINLKSGIEAYYRGNYFEAYSFLYPLAKNDIARAQVRVATMLLQGRGVSPNKAYAQEWFLKALSSIQLAAARGDAWAQSDYGDYFADGIAVPQDFRQAVIWYRRSAEQGYSPAQANLGLMHMHGSGVPPDWNEAIEWFRMAAAQGNYAAQENLRLLEVQPSGTGS
jgi:serine/threonine protein kinase/tetratricopeptide (TPR) repeat protein